MPEEKRTTLKISPEGEGLRPVVETITNDFRIDWGLLSDANDAKAKALKVTLLGDFDENGHVEGADLAYWRGAWHDRQCRACSGRRRRRLRR